MTGPAALDLHFRATRRDPPSIQRTVKRTLDILDPAWRATGCRAVRGWYPGAAAHHEQVFQRRLRRSSSWFTWFALGTGRRDAVPSPRGAQRSLSHPDTPSPRQMSRRACLGTRVNLQGRAAMSQGYVQGARPPATNPAVAAAGLYPAPGDNGSPWTMGSQDPFANLGCRPRTHRRSSGAHRRLKFRAQLVHKVDANVRTERLAPAI